MACRIKESVLCSSVVRVKWPCMAIAKQCPIRLFSIPAIDRGFSFLEVL
jgi:hypothetical protein